MEASKRSKAHRRSKAKRIFISGALTFSFMLGLIGWQMATGRDPVAGRGSGQLQASVDPPAGGSGAEVEGREPGLVDQVVANVAREVVGRVLDGGDDDDDEGDDSEGGWSSPPVSSGAS